MPAWSRSRRRTRRRHFTDYDDNDLYFRTAPSDILQGQVLGEIIIEDGNQTVGILALQDPYGEGLAEDLDHAVHRRWWRGRRDR